MAVNHRDFNKIQKNYKINLDICNVFFNFAPIHEGL
jgi:hypothetical protein